MMGGIKMGGDPFEIEEGMDITTSGPWEDIWCLQMGPCT